MTQGIIFQLIFLTIGYPPGKWNNASEFFVKKDSFGSSAYRWVKENRDQELVKYLNYKYFFVDNNWPTGLEEKCLKNNKLELKFKNTEEDKFIRIYEVK